MVYHKREFLILLFEGCAFLGGEGDEDSWLGVGVCEKNEYPVLISALCEAR